MWVSVGIARNSSSASFGLGVNKVSGHVMGPLALVRALSDQPQALALDHEIAALLLPCFLYYGTSRKGAGNSREWNSREFPTPLLLSREFPGLGIPGNCQSLFCFPMEISYHAYTSASMLSLRCSPRVSANIVLGSRTNLFPTEK